MSWSKVLPVLQDHLGQVQSHRQPGVRGDQERLLKQAWITLKLLEPLHTLATRAARSAASYNVLRDNPLWCSLVTHYECPALD